MTEVRWWRFWADLLILRKWTPMSVTDSICVMLAPCHEKWLYHQPHYNNDNHKFGWGP